MERRPSCLGGVGPTYSMTGTNPGLSFFVLLFEVRMPRQTSRPECYERCMNLPITITAAVSTVSIRHLAAYVAPYPFTRTDFPLSGFFLKTLFHPAQTLAPRKEKERIHSDPVNIKHCSRLSHGRPSRQCRLTRGTPKANDRGCRWWPPVRPKIIVISRSVCLVTVRLPPLLFVTHLFETAKRDQDCQALRFDH